MLCFTRGPQLAVVKCFYEQPFAVHVAKYAVKAPGTAAVLEGQDSKTGTEW